MSSGAWEQLLEIPEWVTTLLGGGLAHWYLCTCRGYVTLKGPQALQPTASVIPYLVFISLLALVFCVGPCAASELPQTCP